MRMVGMKIIDVASWLVAIIIIIVPTDSRPYKNRCRMRPNEYGSCSNAYGVKDGCCELCTTCPPGQGTPLKETRCFTSCSECDKDYFNDRAGTRICTRCSCCEEHHRTTLKACTPFSNAKCSTVCNDGYDEDAVTKVCVKQLAKTEKTTEQRKEKTGVKTLSTQRTPSGRQERGDDVRPTTTNVRRRTEHVEPQNGRRSYLIATIIVCILCAVIITTSGVVIRVVVLSKVCRNRRWSHYESEESTNSPYTAMLPNINNQPTSLLIFNRTSSQYSRIGDGATSQLLESGSESMIRDGGDLQREREGETMNHSSTGNSDCSAPPHALQSDCREMTTNEMPTVNYDSTTLKSLESGHENVSRGGDDFPSNNAQQHRSEDETKEIMLDNYDSTTPKQFYSGLQNRNRCDSDRSATNLWPNDMRTMSLHVEHGQASLTRDSGIQPTDYNLSRGIHMNTSNRDLHVAECHCGNCRVTTCPLCCQRIRVANPTEETNKPPGVLDKTADEEGQAGLRDSSPSCTECAARRLLGKQALSGHQEAVDYSIRC